MQTNLEDNYKAKSVRCDLTPDKLRVFFEIENTEDAVKCLLDFFKDPYLNETTKAMIYYVKPEEVFVKYADIEADLYYAE